jgi:hypothetical protein
MRDVGAGIAKDPEKGLTRLEWPVYNRKGMSLFGLEVIVVDD